MFFKRFRKKDDQAEADKGTEPEANDALFSEERLDVNPEQVNQVNPEALAEEKAASSEPADSLAPAEMPAPPAQQDAVASAAAIEPAADESAKAIMAEAQNGPVAAQSISPEAGSVENTLEENAVEAEDELGFFGRMKQGLSRSSSNFAEGLGNLVLGQKEIDEDLLEEIETQLLVADIGIEATTMIIDSLTSQVARKELANADALYQSLRTQLAEILAPVEQPLAIDQNKQPYVILVVGVNGVGKTTTIGKLAKRLQREGKSVILAAGDTFRAAAVEQLQVWGERNEIPVIAQHTGADSASVIFDAVQSAQSRKADVIIADTAGRLHNKSHLMDELAKVKRVMAKLDVSAPHEVLLVLDAGTGQNALNQAEQFIEAANVTGVALTKLDGTAKGGVIFALSQKFGLPVRFIGVGEGIDDLQPFAAEPFVKALFND